MMTSPTTILVVEDDSDILAVLCVTLEEEGYRTLAAMDGQEALDLVATQQVDLILLDVEMPILDGEGFCHAYRERGGNVPVVLLTAAGPSRIDAAMLVCGAVDSVAKPFDLNQLLTVVARFRGDQEAYDV